MPVRVLVTGAGTGAANNLIRSLGAGGLRLRIVGCHDDRFALRKSSAPRNYLVPPTTHRGFAAAVRDVVRRERIDLVVPTDDDDVMAVSGIRARLGCRTFLPPRAVIALCQDKYRLTVFLRARGVPAPPTYRVADRAGIAKIFRGRRSRAPLWCRMRSGAGSMGATPVTTPAHAWSWITYWREMRGVPTGLFTLSEYLPGRDFAVQSLWQRGRLVLVKTYERLAYFAGAAQPSGVSSIAGLAKTVSAPRVVEVSVAAIRAIDPRATGAFSVDLKEDAGGQPCVTEVNAGRSISGTNLFDLTGKHNMALTYVRLALGLPVEIDEPYDVAEDYYMVRDLDTLPEIFEADDFFDGITEARW